MLSRRLIRIKVMQALYSYYQSEPNDSFKSEKDLFTSFDKIYESYLYLMLLLVELGEAARIAKEDAVNKISVATNHARFIENSIISAIGINQSFIQKVKQRKLSWQYDHEQVQKIFNKLRKTNDYKTYTSTDNENSQQDIDFVLWLTKKLIATEDTLNAYLEERYIYWSDDKDFVISMVIKTLKNLSENPAQTSPLLGLYKDEEDDTRFAKELFKQCIRNNEEYEKAIGVKAANWDSERIALTDMILMKMCLAETTTFTQIPVKVSINEYLEIAKHYSTPKSNTFINGVIDKIVLEWKAEGKINKTGRGLIEN